MPLKIFWVVYFQFRREVDTVQPHCVIGNTQDEVIRPEEDWKMRAVSFLNMHRLLGKWAGQLASETSSFSISGAFSIIAVVPVTLFSLVLNVFFFKWFISGFKLCKCFLILPITTNRTLRMW